MRSACTVLLSLLALGTGAGPVLANKVAPPILYDSDVPLASPAVWIVSAVCLTVGCVLLGLWFTRRSRQRLTENETLKRVLQPHASSSVKVILVAAVFLLVIGLLAAVEQIRYQQELAEMRGEGQRERGKGPAD